jgi:uncharacterized protein
MGMQRSLLDALERGYAEPIRDPLWGHIYLSPGLRALLGDKAFVRLTRIKQLGPASLVYPGATHSRFAHSLGVYHVARSMMIAIVRREGEGPFTDEGLRSFLAAALVHDLGHFPYTHSLKELPLEDHEALTARTVLSSGTREAVAEAGADPERVASIVDRGRKADGETLAYRNILSGVLDPDKLDYLNRDAYYCGVPYGTQDLDFALSRIRLDGDRGVGIDSKGIPSIEHILFAKYLMYRSVYWHRDVRAATSTVKKALASCLAAGRIAPEDLYSLDDESFRALASRMDEAERSLVEETLEGRFLPCRAEAPFEAGNPGHAGIGSLERRLELERGLEEVLAREGGKDRPRVVIDLPERVSFESDVRVVDLDLAFCDASSLFTRETVANFTRALRVIRVFSSRALSVKSKAYLAEKAGLDA